MCTQWNLSWETTALRDHLSETIYSWQLINFNVIEPTTKDHLSWETKFSCSMGSSFKTGFTVHLVRFTIGCLQCSWGDNTSCVTWVSYKPEYCNDGILHLSSVLVSLSQVRLIYPVWHDPRLWPSECRWLDIAPGMTDNTSIYTQYIFVWTRLTVTLTWSMDKTADDPSSLDAESSSSTGSLCYIILDIFL